MKTMQWSILFVITLVGVCNMSGCWIISLLDRPDPMITDAQGRRVFADTPRNWAEWRYIVDSQFENEVMGRNPPRAGPWKEWLIFQIRGIDNLQENAPRYINHIIQSRRNMGLPELDMTRDAQGQYIISDTPQNWSDWCLDINLQIESEKMGETPLWKYPTWKEKWFWQIRNLEEIQENAPRYIDYIIEMRQRAGLPELGVTTDAQGRHIFADTPQNWSDWHSTVDLKIESETKGTSPRSFSTWNDAWLWQIRNLEKIQENAQKYIDYIIETRRNAGLPELDRSVQLPTHT